MNGEDKDMQARFTATSVGGKRAVQALAVAIADQVDQPTGIRYPLLEPSSEHYQHKTYGRIYTPILTLPIGCQWIPLRLKKQRTRSWKSPLNLKPLMVRVVAVA